MKYAIQRQYLLPVYQHLVIEADTVEQACQIATGGTYDWDTSEQDYDSCRETMVEAIRPISKDDEDAEADPGWFIHERPEEAYAAVQRQFRENPPPAEVYLILRSSDMVGTVVYPEAYSSREKAEQAIAADIAELNTDPGDYEIVATRVV